MIQVSKYRGLSNPADPTDHHYFAKLKFTCDTCARVRYANDLPPGWREIHKQRHECVTCRCGKHKRS